MKNKKIRETNKVRYKRENEKKKKSDDKSRISEISWNKYIETNGNYY